MSGRGGRMVRMDLNTRTEETEVDIVVEAALGISEQDGIPYVIISFNGKIYALEAKHIQTLAFDLISLGKMAMGEESDDHHSPN